MGCISSKSELTIEEATSFNLDLLLGYSQVPSKKIFKAYQKHSVDGKVSVEDFSEISSKFGLFNINPDFVQPILNYFTYLKTDMAHYSLKKLLVLSIIQSKGSTDVKAALLFDAICEEELLDAKGLNELFTLVFDLLLKMLTGIRVNDFVNELSPNDLKMFEMKLRRGIPNTLKIVMSNYLGHREVINKQEFVIDSQHKFPPEFLTGHGIRSLLKMYSGESKISH